MATPAHDASSNSGVKTAESSTSSYSHTAGTLTNGVAIIGVAHSDGTGLLSAVTYNGAAATALELNYELDSSVPQNRYLSLYIYKNPPAGASAVVATFDEVVDAHAVMVSTYSNVDQTTSTGTVAKATTAGSGGTTATVNVTSAVGELVVDAALARENGADTLTVGASQTQRNNVDSDTNWVTATSDEAGAASVTMSWTLAGSDLWEIIGVSLKPSSGLVNLLVGKFGGLLQGKL